MEGAPTTSPSREEEQPKQEQPNGRPPELEPQLRLMPWVDPVVEAQGFGPRSMYVETCWLPVMGPTATWLYRRLGSWAEFNPEGVTIDLEQISRSLGLGEGVGRHSKIAKALGRLARYQAARVGGGELQVRRALPPLPLRLVRGLDTNTQRLHERYTSQPRKDQNGLVK